MSLAAVLARAAGRLAEDLEARNVARCQSALERALVRELDHLDLRLEPVPWRPGRYRLDGPSQVRLADYVRAGLDGRRAR